MSKMNCYTSERCAAAPRTDLRRKIRWTNNFAARKVKDMKKDGLQIKQSTCFGQKKAIGMADKKIKKPNHTVGTKGGSSSEKRTYFKQADFPQTTLQQAQKISSALVDNFAGREGSPPDIALSIGISPTSSGWPALAGSSVAYGLTEGGVNANVIKLTSLGRKLVAPEQEGDDLAARREAILSPRISKEFFERYRRAKFPNDTIGGNVLNTLGLPRDRVQSALAIVKENGRYAGIIRDTPTGPFVNLDSPGVPAPTATPALPEHDADEENPDETQEAVGTGAKGSTAAPPPRISSSVLPSQDAKTNRVFISHGKQKSIVTQLKELLSFGNFDPVEVPPKRWTGAEVICCG